MPFREGAERGFSRNVLRSLEALPGVIRSQDDRLVMPYQPSKKPQDKTIKEAKFSWQGSASLTSPFPKLTRPVLVVLSLCGFLNSDFLARRNLSITVVILITFM